MLVLVMVKDEYKYSDITEKIIGAAMRVHSFLGNGFQEVIYQRALSLELHQDGLEHVMEQEQTIYYRDFQKPIGTRRADIIVEEKVIVELKAISQLEARHYAQLLNYLQAYRYEVGLLINFGETSLKFRRMVL